MDRFSNVAGTLACAGGHEGHGAPTLPSVSAHHPAPLWFRRLYCASAQAVWCLAIVLFVSALAGCTREPTEQELQPPSAWQWAWERSGAARVMRVGADRTLDYLEGSQLPPEAAPLLAATIRISKRQAEAERRRRIPEHVRRALEPFFDEAVLKNVRWTLPDGRPGLGSMLTGWYFRTGGAVTFDDVVVVSDEDMAENVWLWAHELTHVEQYRRFGIDGFAREYIVNWRGLEEAAHRRANQITLAIRMKKRCQSDASCGTRRA